MFQIYEFLPGAVTRTKQWDNLHYHNVLLELFFSSNTLPYAKQMDIHDFTDEIYWKQLPMWWNKWTGWVFDMKGIKMKVQPFTSGAGHRLSTYKLWKNFGGMHSEKPSEKKTLRSVPSDSNSVIEWSRFFLHESMRNMMARDSFLHLRLSLLINAL